MTLFPEMVMGGLNNSIIKRAMEKELISIEAVNIRDYTLDKHKKVDDYPFGGGAGMLMQAQPVYDCYKAVIAKISGKAESDAFTDKTRVLYMSPQGKTFHQAMAKELSEEENLIFLCGHYEGIDERVIDRIVTDRISIGDYVLTGGELPALCIMDCISRLVPGVLGNDESGVSESFSDDLLEYPQYTRPADFRGMAVPEVLLSGHAANIETWRHEQALMKTRQNRPELLGTYGKYYKNKGK